VLVSVDAISARMADWPKGRLRVFDGALHELLMERADIRGPFLQDSLALFAANQD